MNDQLKVYEGGRPDDEKAILGHLSELSKSRDKSDDQISPRIQEMRSTLTDDEIAKKYIRFVILKIGTVDSMIVQRDWIPALHTLLDTIQPEGKGEQIVEAEVRNEPTLYGSDVLDRAMRMWRGKKRNRAKNV